MKTCGTCKTEKPHSEFRRNMCKACWAAYMREYTRRRKAAGGPLRSRSKSPAFQVTREQAELPRPVFGAPRPNLLALGLRWICT